MIIKNFLFGLIIGIGFIIPGVSGGVLAAILGIYSDIIDKTINFFNDFKNNLKFLLPLFIGISISVLLFSNIILYLLDYKKIFISYVFIGLILGCIPYLLKCIKIKSNKSISIIPFILSFIIGFILYLIQNNINETLNTSFFVMFIAGIFYAIGKIIPGISGASLLMLLGIYEYFLEVISNPLNINFNIIVTFIPFIFSLLISSFLLIKLMNYLLKNHYRITYSAIIGFIISSILFIYPNYISLSSIIILICSFIISYYLSN